MSTEEIREENENHEKKPENKGESGKTLAIKCGALVLCAAILCTLMIKGSSSYSKTLIDDADKKLFAFIRPRQSTTEPYNPGGESYIVEDTLSQDGDSNPEANEFDVTTVSVVDNGAEGDKISDMTKAQIVSLYNNAVNGAKKNSKSIKQNYAKNTPADNTKNRNKLLQSVVDSVVKRYSGEDKAKHNKVYTSDADKKVNFPVSGESWASKLTADDVKKASITESDGTYTIRLELKDDSQANLKAGEGHMGKGISLVTVEQIADTAGKSGMRFIEKDSIKLTHWDGVIKADVDKKTGRLKTANFSHKWKLAFKTAVFDLDEAITFGTEEDFVINW